MGITPCIGFRECMPDNTRRAARHSRVSQLLVSLEPSRHARDGPTAPETTAGE